MENIKEGTGNEHGELQRSVSADGSTPKHTDETPHMLCKSMPDLYAHDKLKMESLKDVWGPELGGRGSERQLKN